MREIKYRCAYQGKIYNVKSIDFANQKINLVGADIINFSDGYLMQFTGLKDKNDKEIYEGDILKLLHGTYKVKYRPDLGAFVLCEKESYVYYLSLTEDVARTIEIIGNIHDNPELLEVKE